MGGDFFDQEKGKDCFRLRKGGEHFQTNFSQNPIPGKNCPAQNYSNNTCFQSNTGSTEGNHKDTIHYTIIATYTITHKAPPQQMGQKRETDCHGCHLSRTCGSCVKGRKIDQ